MDAGWDMHSNDNSPTNLGGMHWLGTQVDHAVAAFLDDVEAARPERQDSAGRQRRDGPHAADQQERRPRPLGQPDARCLLAGGGLKMGQVIGQSDKQAGAPATEKYTPENLLATVMQTLLDLGQVRVMRDVPKNVMDVVSGGKPIAPLF